MALSGAFGHLTLEYTPMAPHAQAPEFLGRSWPKLGRLMSASGRRFLHGIDRVRGRFSLPDLFKRERVREKTGQPPLWKPARSCAAAGSKWTGSCHWMQNARNPARTIPGYSGVRRTEAGLPSEEGNGAERILQQYFGRNAVQSPQKQFQGLRCSLLWRSIDERFKIHSIRRCPQLHCH